MDSRLDGDDGTDVRVFLVDDHAVVRAGLAAYLGTEPQGTTPGGGVAYAPAGSRTHDVIVVRDGEESFEYALMGGP